jgi:hypothetical protein
MDEPEPEEWKPVRCVLLIIAAAMAIALMVLVAGDVTRVMKRRTPRRSENKPVNSSET